MAESKVCGTCGIEKPLTEFFRNGNKAFKDGRARQCKMCAQEAQRKSVNANREKRREYNRDYYAKKYPNDPEFRAKILAARKAEHDMRREFFKKNPEAHEAHKELYRQYARRHYDKHRERFREERNTPEGKLKLRVAMLKSRYGITLEQFEKLVSRHHGGCWICGKDNAKGRGGTLVIDHCHESQKIRGALCDLCNTTLGVLGDTIPKIHESTARFVKYLEAAEKFDVNDL